MKLITLLLTLPLFASAQSIDASLRIGMNTKPSTLVIAPGFDFKAHGLALSPEMIIDVAQDQPANFGLKLSYEVPVSIFKLRAGAGMFYQLYSLDKYDMDKNGYKANVFFSAQYDKWFGMIEYMNGVRLSIGVRTRISGVEW